MFDNDIPVVMLLLGGDFTTLMAICEGLKDGTPVVVVRVRTSVSENMLTILNTVSLTNLMILAKTMNVVLNEKYTNNSSLYCNSES